MRSGMLRPYRKKTDYFFFFSGVIPKEIEHLLVTARHHTIFEMENNFGFRSVIFTPKSLINLIGFSLRRIALG